MNLAELRSTAKSYFRENTTELDSFIRDQANIAYRKYCRMRTWNALTVPGQSITAVGSTNAYYLPYPFERLIRDSLRYDFISGTQGGSIIPVAMTESDIGAYRSFAPSTTPQSVSIGGGGTTLYSTGTAAVAVNGTAVTGTGTTWVSATHAGQWIRFGTDTDGDNAGDYGYLISAVGSTTSITLATPYRGPTLSGATYAIRPANTPRLIFDPVFTENGKTIQFAYQRKPERLYSDDDVLEVEELSDAVLWTVVAQLYLYHSRTDESVVAFGQARSALKDATGFTQA